MIPGQTETNRVYRSSGWEKHEIENAMGARKKISEEARLGNAFPLPVIFPLTPCFTELS